MFSPLEIVSIEPEVVRTLITLGGVVVPLIIATAQFIARPLGRQGLGALILTTTWNTVFLFIGNELAVAFGWWTFGEAGPQIGNVPVALLLGWVILWGPLAAQIRLHPAPIVGLLLVIDLIAMPLMDSVVVLGPNWLVGEAALLSFVAFPGLLLTRWVGDPKRVAVFTGLQVAMFAAILMWVIPFLATATVGQPLTLDVPTWAYGAVFVAFGVPALPALIAVRDFVINNGSPWPWDTTDRPVLSGPYRYLRSPMQLAGGLTLISAAFLYGHWSIAAGAVSSMVFAQVFCLLERDDLDTRFGPNWTAVASEQKQWIPSWRPHPKAATATVWINQGCDTCAPISSFLAARNPVGLEIRWAHEHPEALTRLRYERADGAVFDGVAAVGACLEHLDLAWAFVGWLLRLPGAWRFWQLIGDAVGFAPRPAIAAEAELSPPPGVQAVQATAGIEAIPR